MRKKAAACCILKRHKDFLVRALVTNSRVSGSPGGLIQGFRAAGKVANSIRTWFGVEGAWTQFALLTHFFFFLEWNAHDVLKYLG